MLSEERLWICISFSFLIAFETFVLSDRDGLGVSQAECFIKMKKIDRVTAVLSHLNVFS